MDDSIVVMASVNTKLANANEKLKAEDCSVKEVSKILSEAGKETQTIDKEIIETIEVVEEFSFLEKTLMEFVELDTQGLLETELEAAEALIQHQAIQEATKQYMIMPPKMK